MRARAAAIGREIGVFSRAQIYCRPTQKEAFDYDHYAVVEHADWGAVDGQLQIFDSSAIRIASRRSCTS